MIHNNFSLFRQVRYYDDLITCLKVLDFDDDAENKINQNKLYQKGCQNKHQETIANMITTLNFHEN